MITGFNTDVEFGGKVYHVQTEDKGLDNPIIESLIYIGGEILGSRRLPYADHVESGFNEKIVIQLMEQQHRDLLIEVRQGKFCKADDRTVQSASPGDSSKMSDESLDNMVLNYLVTKPESD